MNFKEYLKESKRFKFLPLDNGDILIKLNNKELALAKPFKNKYRIDVIDSELDSYHGAVVEPKKLESFIKGLF